MAAIEPRCQAIAAKAANGALTADEIVAVFDTIEKRRKRLEAEGNLTGKAERIRKWAAEEGERAKIAAAMQRRHAALNVLVRQRLDRQVGDMVNAGLRPHQALRAVLEGINSPARGSRQSTAAARQAYEARYVGAMFADFEKDRPHLVHALTDEKLDADTLTEMWELREGGKPGSTGNDDAKYLAKKFADYAELSRTELNRLGASIGKLDGWAGVQTHDPIKMLQAGREAWIGRIVTLLDLDRTFPEGVTRNEAIDALSDVFDTLITGLPNKVSGAEKGARVNPANLAKSLGASRVLHFKDAKATLAYREQFGYGNTIAGMFQHQRHMAQVAGAMETFGPNPEVMFRAVAATMQRNIRNSRTIPDALKPKLIEKLKVDTGVLKQALDIATGLASRPENVTVAKIGSNIRATQSMAKLGAALWSSLVDPITSGLAAQFRGGNFARETARQFGGLMRGRPRGEQGVISYLLGEGIDGMIGHITARGYAADGATGVFGQLQETFFKWSGLTGWTDVNRTVAARTIAAELGMHSGTSFAKLPPRFANVLRQAGIEDAEWSVLSKATLRLDNGRPYLTPDRVRELSDADIAPLVQDRIDAIVRSRSADKEARIAGALNDGRRQLEIKLLSYVADQTSSAMIEPDARTQRYMTQGLRAGTPAGEVIRFIMQFKSFPTAFTTRVVGRALYAHRKDAGLLERGAHMGSLLGGLVIGGYLSMMAKDMLKGYWPPRDPSDPRTMLAALQQAGALGIYGDFLFSKVNRFGGGLIETAIGPTLGSVGDLADIAFDARDAALSLGEDQFSGARAFSNLTGNLPFANLYYVKPALDYMILNSVREAISPGYMRRQARNREREYGQKSVPQLIGAPASLDPLNVAGAF